MWNQIKFLSFFLVSCSLIGAVIIARLSEAEETTSFKDLSPSHWAFQAVTQSVNNNLLTGFPDKTFQGDKGMTRYEMAMVIHKFSLHVEKKEQAILAQWKQVGTGKLAALEQQLNEIEEEIQLADARLAQARREKRKLKACLAAKGQDKVEECKQELKQEHPVKK